MKRILLALSLLATVPTIQGFSKEKEKDYTEVVVKNAYGEFTYEGVVTIEGKTKDELFKKSNTWVLSNFKTGDNNIQADAESGTIISSTTIVLPAEKGLPSTLVNFKLNLQFKEGRYKYVMDNIIVSFATFGSEKVIPYGENMLPTWKRYNFYIIKEVNKAFLKISTDLENSLKQTANKQDDNW